MLTTACAGTPARSEEEAAPETEIPLTADAMATVPAPDLLTPQDVSDLESKSLTIPCVEGGANEVMLLDATRKYLSDTACAAALWFDGLFGEHGDIDVAQRTHGRVELSVFYSQFEHTQVRLRFNVNIRLPTLEHRLSVFFGRENEDDFARGRTEGFALRSQFVGLDNRDEFLGGLGYSLPGTDVFQSDFRVGVRNLRRPTIFVQNRFGYNAYADTVNLIHLGAVPFWNNRDGFGITPSVDLDHVVAPTLLLRWGNVGTRSEKSAGFDWRSAVILYQNLYALRAIAYEVFVRGATGADVPLTEYGVRTIYRQPFFDRRLFCEFAVGYSWPRTDPLVPREGSFGAGASVQMPFGRRPAKSS